MTHSSLRFTACQLRPSFGGRWAGALLLGVFGLATIPSMAWADWETAPGNAYPRKHTVFLNFDGANLKAAGQDNSALDKSVLAKPGAYPRFAGTDSIRTAALQAFRAIAAPYGLVVTDERPPPVVPYTMVLIGGRIANTAQEGSAAGIAPGADCEARWQRHVVYAFADPGWTSGQIAQVAAQEAGHAFGLDHTLNCDSVMSYCGILGSKAFSRTCDPLCETGCQGEGSIGCEVTHDRHCPEGARQQNEGAELTYLFGTADADVTPPVVEIDQPLEGSRLPSGEAVDIRAVVTDDFGGFGFEYLLEDPSRVLQEQVVFEPHKNVDDQGRFRAIATLPDGAYRLTVSARDHFDHVARDRVVFVVGDAPVPDPAAPFPSDDLGGTDTDGSSATDGTHGMTDAPRATDDTGTASGDTQGGPLAPPEPGCGCQSVPGGGFAGPGVAGWMFGVLSLGLRRGARRWPRPARDRADSEAAIGASNAQERRSVSSRSA